MAQIVYSRRALADVARVFEFLAEDPERAEEALAVIAEAISVLERHPFIGRRAEYGLRELVISFGPTGYIALYRHLPEHDAVLVLTLRHQLESGYKGD